ncbi:MAG: M6 family metalloprotease domain-containing protein [Prevotella sp.]|nr:M6 family metalloprotease domain-containing protein [Prevotella sp.]
MRKLFLTFSLAFFTFVAFAIPAMRGIWKTVTLADGKQIQVQLHGDEFLSYWQTADGAKYIINPQTGIFEPADLEHLQADAEQFRSIVNEDRALRAPAKRTNIGDESSSYTGEKKGIIILVQFPDLQFQSSNNQELYNRIANEENFTYQNFVGSVRDYFEAQSYGRFILDFDVVGPVTVSHNYAYYGAHNGSASDNYQHIGEMVVEACQAVDDQVNFADYDWDEQGDVEQVFILYAGQGEASGGDVNTIWPHEYRIGATSSYGSTITLDGVTINTYACSNELNAAKSIDGIGAFCHEFSHCLGLPDMYDTNNPTDGNYGMGYWDILDSGSYNGNSFVPAGYTSYERMFCNWLTPIALESDQQISNMKSLTDSGEAYIIYNDNHKQEYYLLENRTKTRWDASINGSGLLVLHVDFNSNIWANNQVNSSTYMVQHCTIIPANNNLSTSTEVGHPYPYLNNNSLTNSTTPATTLNNRNTDGTYYMNKALSNISQNSDGTVSFYFENNNQNTSDFDAPSEYFFYESFDKCDGLGGNDGIFTGSTVGSGSFTTDNDGWYSLSKHGANQCALFGSSNTTGTARLPEVTTTADCYLLFKAAPYTGDGTDLSLEVYSGDVTLSKTSFVMTEGSWTAFTAQVIGAGTFKLQLKPTKRFFLDEVYLTYDVSGINSITTDISPITDGRIFSLDGRYLGTDLNSLPKGIYIMNGKKFLK